MIAAIYARKSSVRYLRILGALFGLRILTTSARGEGAWVDRKSTRLNSSH